MTGVMHREEARMSATGALDDEIGTTLLRRYGNSTPACFTVYEYNGLL